MNLGIHFALKRRSDAAQPDVAQLAAQLSRRIFASTCCIPRFQAVLFARLCCLLHFCPARAAHLHNKRYQARTANVQMPMPMNIIITDTSILYKVISHNYTTK